jgi:AcrR family transcriptional regulator
LKKRTAAKKKGYHHGNLRASLLEAARQVLASEGADALSLREVARRAGVTHAAPYRHFPDKESLLAAIAEEGFRGLTSAIIAAVDEGKDEPVQRVLSAGRGYIRFAVSHPHHYRLMFGRHLENWDEHPALKEAGKAAFGKLVELIAEAQAAKRIRPGNPTVFAGACWSMSHGLAMGFLDGIFEMDELAVTEEQQETFAATVFEALAYGVAVPAAKR